MANRCKNVVLWGGRGGMRLLERVAVGIHLRDGKGSVCGDLKMQALHMRMQDFA